VIDCAITITANLVRHQHHITENLVRRLRVTRESMSDFHKNIPQGNAADDVKQTHAARQAASNVAKRAVELRMVWVRHYAILGGYDIIIFYYELEFTDV
jgi:hypothetical protein